MQLRTHCSTATLYFGSTMAWSRGSKHVLTREQLRGLWAVGLTPMGARGAAGGRGGWSCRPGLRSGGWIGGCGEVERLAGAGRGEGTARTGRVDGWEGRAHTPAEGRRCSCPSGAPRGEGGPQRRRQRQRRLQ